MIFRIDRIRRCGGVANNVKSCFSVSILHAVYRPSAETRSIDFLAELLSWYIKYDMIVLDCF